MKGKKLKKADREAAEKAAAREATEKASETEAKEVMHKQTRIDDR